MSRTATHRDPTFEGAVRLEIEQKNCLICVRRHVLSDGRVRCGTGLTFPQCRRKRTGFVLDMGAA